MLKRFQRKDGPCGVSFEIGPFPKYIDGGYDTKNLLLVSKKFSTDIKSAAHHIRLKIHSAISRSLTGVHSYSQQWTTGKLMPYARELIRSGRHIFAGYGHNTTATILSMPPEVAHEVTSIFLTAFVFSYNYPRNWGRIDDATDKSQFSVRFNELVGAFPNAKVLAVSCGSHGIRTQIQSRDHYLLNHITNVFHGVFGPAHKIKYLEMVYWGEGIRWERQNTSLMSRWSTDFWDDYIKRKGGVRLSAIELDGRGRYWSHHEHVSDTFVDLLVEGTVWRISDVGHPLEPTIDTPDFEDPFADLCATDIFTPTEAELEAQREPILWEERCWGKACDCGNNCDIYTRRVPAIPPDGTIRRPTCIAS
ncbi:hypothetical protein TWF730_007102 [Orbilia blumenaviensis]|uniref:Uncharacterized protein n=1 Tax=Orbilia blumenaviensis TaxID=1796055 RepID=A0AAV9VG96_9PEZI